MISGPEAEPIHKNIVTLPELHGLGFNPWWGSFTEHIRQGKATHNELAIVGPSGVGKTALETAIIKDLAAQFNNRYIYVFGLGLGLSYGRGAGFVTFPQGEIPSYEYVRNSRHIAHVGNVVHDYFPDSLAIGVYDGSVTAITNKFGQRIGVDRDQTHLERIGKRGGYFIVIWGAASGPDDISNLAYGIRSEIPKLEPEDRYRFLVKHGVYPDQTNGEALLEAYGKRTGNLATRIQHLEAINGMMLALIEGNELPPPKFKVEKPGDFFKHPEAALEFQLQHFLPLWLERTVGSDWQDRSLVIINKRVPADTGIQEYRSLLREYGYPRQLLRMAIDEAGKRGDRDVNSVSFIKDLLIALGVPFDDLILLESRTWEGYHEWTTSVRKIAEQRGIVYGEPTL